jgi:hypothetical protein
MAFAALLAFIFVLGLRGGQPTRRTYIAIAVAAVAFSVWEYLG